MFEIRTATEQEFTTAVKWAENEGWNPGLHDMSAFYKADPHGFLIGVKDGEIISSISVVKYAADFGFLGFYIVLPQYRGQGFGWQTWQAGLNYLKGCSIGLDGVIAQQENYLKSGFSYAYENIRFQGPASFYITKPENAQTLAVRNGTADDLPAIKALDLECFGSDRSAFLKAWTSADKSAARQTKIALSDGKLKGFGTIRKCQEGYKIGPLFTGNAEVARILLSELAATVPPKENIMLDLPKPNLPAINLAEELGLAAVFSTARMYRGKEPKINLSKIFGITTFELG